MKHALEITAQELRTLQETDSTLEELRKAVKYHPDIAGTGFLQKKGLIYRCEFPLVMMEKI